MCMKDILKDLISDLVGGTGITMIATMPMIDELTSVVKLLGACGGLILLFVSIRYKIELIREKKRENKEKESKK